MPLFKKNKPPGKLKQWFQKTFGKRVSGWKQQEIGKSDIGIGMTYVALSRLKTLDGLFLKYKPYDRYQKINDSTMLRLRQLAENELRKFRI